MPDPLAVQIHPHEFAQIVTSVFETMLKLEVTECAAAWFPGSDRLTSAVHLMGDWNGAVVLECNQRQACRFAARFLSIPPPGAVDDVVRDVLGELANMIGGNLKCVLARGIRLSMPSVVDGSDYSVRVCGAELRNRLSFHCDEGVFWVTVLTTKSP
jgi:chemotaxis protein CheX